MKLHITSFLNIFLIIGYVICVTDELENWFNRTTNPVKYKKWIKPPPIKKPTEVNVSIHLYTLAFLDEASTEFSAQLLLRFSWIDKRLKSDHIIGIQEITEGNGHYLERIWNPLLHIPNNHEAFAIVDSTHTLFRIKTTGEVLTSKRIKLRVYCNLNLRNYPLDKQICEIVFESASLPLHQLHLRWSKKDPISITNSFKLFGYKLLNISLREGISTFSKTGNFSKVMVLFEISRSFGQFLLDIYIPSILFVITSWIGFWIEIPAAPARVTLGMTTMLTLVTSARNSREKLPRVSYIHALDIWIVTCTCFVFFTLIEYAAVNHIYYKDKRCKKRRAMRKCASSTSFLSLIPDSQSLSISSPKKSPNNLIELGLSKNRLSVCTLKENENQISIPETRSSVQIDNFLFMNGCPSSVCTTDIANSIDRKCRIIYPCFFIVFNIIYWSILLAIEF